MTLTRHHLKHPLRAFREVKTSAVKKLHLLHAPAPILAKIETTRRCNLNCVVCFRHSLPVRPDMKLSNFLKILGLLPKVEQVALHGYGEPLVHKDFLKLADAIRNRGKRILLVTNGMFLNGDMTEDLTRSNGVQMISFSVDSFHAEGYRGNDYYTGLAETIRNVVESRNAYGTDAKIIIHSTFNLDNIHTMPRMIEFAHETNVDTISLQDITYLYEAGDSTSEKAIRLRTPSQHEQEHPLRDKVVVATLVAAEKAVELGVDAQFHLKEEDRCHWLWHSIYIDVEGNVYPCTDTLNYPLGNVFNDSIKEIWNGDEIRHFRTHWIQNPVDECRKCISYGR
jgi:MoaA/NifB/PqqE/SkfB family radical SAM enzyme